MAAEVKLLKLLTYRRVEQSAVFGHYGQLCACCGTAYWLTIDHIDGNSQQHHAEIGGRQKLYRWLIANGFPPGFQTLCAPCNSSKRSGNRCRLDHRAGRCAPPNPVEDRPAWVRVMRRRRPAGALRRA
jgi:hypothetical protein